jgi:hypothetical protein
VASKKKIRAILPDIEILTPIYWTAICKKFPDAVNSRFRQLITIPESSIVQAISEIYLQDYTHQLQERIQTLPYTLLIYSNRRNQLFELPVSLDFSVEEILTILRGLFKLPKQQKYEDVRISTSIIYSLIIDDQKVPLEKRLSELQLPLDEKPLVTFFTQIVVRDEEGEATIKRIEFLELPIQTSAFLSPHDRSQIAIERFEQEIDEAFNQAIKSFERKNENTSNI